MDNDNDDGEESGAQLPDHVAQQIEEEYIPNYHEQLTEEESGLGFDVEMQVKNDNEVQLIGQGHLEVEVNDFEQLYDDFEVYNEPNVVNVNLKLISESKSRTFITNHTTDNSRRFGFVTSTNANVCRKRQYCAINTAGIG
jgi:hypothetical protein